MEMILIDPPGERIDGLAPLPGCALRGAPLISCAERCWQLLRFDRSRPEAVRAKGRVDKRPVRVIKLRAEPLPIQTCLTGRVNSVAERPPFDPHRSCGCWERKISPPVVKGWLNVHLPHVRQGHTPSNGFSTGPSFHTSSGFLLSRPHEQNSRAIIKRNVNLDAAINRPRFKEALSSTIRLPQFGCTLDATGLDRDHAVIGRGVKRVVNV